MRKHIHKYSFTLESECGIYYRECTASFCVIPEVKETRNEPFSPAEVDWFDFSSALDNGHSTISYNTREDFEKWARSFTGKPEWTLNDLDNEALLLADDYEAGKREEAYEQKAESKRERLREDALEATTRGDN